MRIEHAEEFSQIAQKMQGYGKEENLYGLANGDPLNKHHSNYWIIIRIFINGFIIISWMTELSG